MRYATYTDENRTSNFIIGTGAEIRPIFKSMYRAWENDNSRITPVFREERETHFRFSDDRVYGIEVTEDNWFSVWGAQQLCKLWLVA